MNDILNQYGLPGIVIGALVWYILHIEKSHSLERKEWKKAMDNNTAVLASLKTLLETFLIKKRNEQNRN